jgi:hypothetical protein
MMRDYDARPGDSQVISCIQTSVYPNCWADTVGGPFTMAPYQLGDQYLLVISAPTLIHLSIQSLLDTLNHANRHGGSSITANSFKPAQRVFAKRLPVESIGDE